MVGVFRFPDRYSDVIWQTLVVRGDETHPVFAVETPDHGVGIALQHLDHVALTASATIQSGDPDHDPVTVKQGAHLACRHKYVVAFIVRHQEAEAILMSDHPSLYQVKLVGQRITIAPVAHQLAIPQHGVQTAPQRLHTRLVVDIE